MEDFLKAHPSLILDAILDDRSVDLVGEGVDLAFRLGDQPESSLIVRKLSAAPRHVVAAPAYLDTYGTPASPADLLAHTIITYSPASDAEVWRFQQGGRDLSIKVPKRMSVSAAEGVRAAVLGGMGLAIGSNWMFAPELARGEVVPVLTDWMLSPVTLWAAFPAGRLHSVKAQKFVDFVQSKLP